MHACHCTAIEVLQQSEVRPCVFCMGSLPCAQRQRCLGCIPSIWLLAASSTYGAAGATGKVVARCTFLPLLRNLLAPVAEIAPADVNGQSQYARGLQSSHSTAQPSGGSCPNIKFTSFPCLRLRICLGLVVCKQHLEWLSGSFGIICHNAVWHGCCLS